MAYQLTRPRPSRPSTSSAAHHDLRAEGDTPREEEEKWPLGLRVLFIAGSTALLWTLIIITGLLWLAG